MDSLTWNIFDILGTIAFAVSGAMVGIGKRMDIFGIIVLALLTAVGGGMVRDVLAGVTPPAALCNITDFTLAVLTAILVSILYMIWPLSHLKRQRMAMAYNICDTVGLASFTITGFITGLSHSVGNPYVLPVLLGIITAVGGGVLRDLMALKMPVVLYKDIYATASLAGAVACCFAYEHFGIMTSAWICFAVIVFLRYGAIVHGWHLLHPNRHQLHHTRIWKKLQK